MAYVRPNKRRLELGFTLIETMIAMALVGFGLLVIVQLQGIGSRGLKRTVESSVAMNLATNTLEGLMVMAYDTDNDGYLDPISYEDLNGVSSNTYFDLFGYPADSAVQGKFTVRWDATQADDSYYADVNVEVFWNTRPPAPETSEDADHSIRRFSSQILNPDKATK